jgi:glycosyltransferase involved in cell wall biosynthesis
MRIAHISTYPPIECGIATYASFLVEAMAKTPNEIHVISQHGAKGEGVTSAYFPQDGDLAKKIFEMTIRVTPDIVHIQHEYGLYGEMDGVAVVDLIFRFKTTGVPVIATLHTVQPAPDHRKKMILQGMAKYLDGIIGHEESHANLLESVYGVDPSKVLVIPHGARNTEPVEGVKEELGLEGKKVLLLVGYFRPTKCFDKIVDLFPRIVEKCPDAWLVISGKMRMLEFSAYRDALFASIDSSPARERIEVFRGQFPQHTFDAIISASDVMAFPYSAGAQSGVMAHAFAFGKPVVTSDLPAFQDAVRKSKAGFAVSTDDEYVDKIALLLNDDELRAEFSENARRYVREEISWDIVVEKTLAFYKKFDVNFPRSRYVYLGT